MPDDRANDARPNTLARIYGKAGPVVLLLFGLLWLFVSVTNLVIDPSRWGYYLMFLLGILVIVVALHPMTRTPLSWPLPVVDVGERVVVQERANWVAGIARGGTLVVTTQRVIFEPNSMEAALKLQTRTWEWSTVRAIELAPRGLNLAGGAVRRRLRLLMADGSAELFVVQRPEELRRHLISLIPQQGSDEPG